MRSNEGKRNSTHKDDRNGTSSLSTHDKCLLNVGRLAGSTDESAEAIISHLYLLIGLVHVVNHLFSVENNYKML